MSSRLIVNSIRHTGASGDAVTLANDGTCTAKITNNLSNRNLVINGAMQVAQRGTSSTDSPGYGSDRFPSYHYNTNEAVTSEQADVASGTTPYTLGFRKCLKLTNGNQTSGPQGDGYAGWIQHRIEAQNIVQSGWNYTSASSYITLSFWVKSSVAQDFKGYLRSMDGTNQMYPFATGSLSADTWTKITKTIPGNSNIQIDNNNGHGLQINIVPFIGTNYTDNATTENSWAAYASASRIKDVTTTWYNTNDATFEITGVQLEVSDHASDFEFLSYADDLRRCQRYYQQIVDGNSQTIGLGFNFTTTEIDVVVDFTTAMRAAPSLKQVTGGDYFAVLGGGDSNTFIDGTWSIFGATTSRACIYATADASTAGKAKYVRTHNASARLAFDSEL